MHMVDFSRRVDSLSATKRALLALLIHREQATTPASEEAGHDKRLIAYLVMHQEPALSDEALRVFLQAKLPDYMVPSVFVRLDALPLMANGKVDRQALPTPDQARAARQETYVAPRTAVEEVLAGIWADMLGIERVGMHDNFFELGGHSLLATQVIARICSTFQVQLPVRLFFGAPTVAQLARLMLATETKPGQAETLARLLQQVKGMSAEEVQQQLQRQQSEVAY
jgi:surfactin family lipopeptide synthetase C